MTLLALAFAPARTPRSRSTEGLAGARLGNTRADVRRALGKPSKVQQGRNDFGRWVSYRFAGKITVFFQGREVVTSVQTAGLGDRTASGIGVGSTEADLTKSIKGLTCEDVGANVRTCHTGEFIAGRARDRLPPLQRQRRERDRRLRHRLGEVVLRSRG